MSENSTPEERIELAAQARLDAIRENRAAGIDKPETNSSLTTLGLISVLGFVLAIIGYVVVIQAETIQVVTIWGGIVGTGVMVGFLALIAYYATKAIITSR